MTGASLTFASVSVGYRPANPLLSALNLEVEPGEVLAVVGPNGAGKTTLFKTIMGFMPALSGEVSIDGQPAMEFRQSRGIGFLPEVSVFPPGLSSEGVLRLAAAATARPHRSIEECCALGGVDFDLGPAAATLSKGMGRRLGNAVALLSNPPLILLDEPESGLDPGQRVGLRSRIEQMSQTATVLIASHDLREATAVCGRALLVKDGSARLVEPEPDETRLDPERLEAFFLPPGEDSP